MQMSGTDLGLIFLIGMFVGLCFGFVIGRSTK
jgi:hypothetical protein